MGCATSHEARKEVPENVRPLSRSYSLPFGRSLRNRRHRRRDIHSNCSSPCSVKLDVIIDDASNDSRQLARRSVDSDKGSNLSSVVRKAQKWSEMIEMKIPKSPTDDNEAVEDKWELVGDTDHNPLRHFPGVERTFSVDGEMRGKEEGGEGKVDEKRQPSAAEASSCEGGGARRRKGSILGLPPLSPSPAVVKEKVGDGGTKEKAGDGGEGNNERRIRGVRSRIAAKFHEKISARWAARARAAAAARAYTGPPGGQRKVVLYLTSLRGIRKTYDDSCDTLAILKGYDVRIDERDVSMHSDFKGELIDILGPNFGGAQLPRVFANGNYLGGANEIRLLHDNGKLSKAFTGCLPAPRKGSSNPCDMCGDMRFIPCETCNGSCKIYKMYVEGSEKEGEGEGEGEGEEEEGDEEEEDVEREEETEREYDSNEEDEEIGRFIRCPDCNENGLVRCLICCKE